MSAEAFYVIMEEHPLVILVLVTVLCEILGMWLRARTHERRIRHTVDQLQGTLREHGSGKIGDTPRRTGS